jgi:hypothetical protein
VGGIENALGGVNGDVGAQLDEKLVLHLVDAILCVENERLVLFQVGRDVALAVRQVWRRLYSVGTRLRLEFVTSIK